MRTRKINKILIANRGEIAVRVMQAAQELGIETVAIFSPTDKLALHVKCADVAVPIHVNEMEPYLDIAQIIDVAIKNQVDAIHPGYGFLSESAVFAKEVIRHGLVFIGPSAKSIELMGDKLRSKQLAQKLGIPVISAFEVESEELSNINQLVETLEFPSLLKARAGGGGKGMRVVHDAVELQEVLPQAVNEASQAFGDGRMLVEKYLEDPKHIEVQIMADQAGSCVFLGERECSVQRRHQKVIEEAPASGLSDALRIEMGQHSVALAKACDYAGAGTLEFLVDKSGQYYFLEMNTRLQVEHAVTECVTGIDLVKEQIKIAQGQPLSFSQQDVNIQGHAIELRIYAEDPTGDFLPDTGKLVVYNMPVGPGIRIDNGYCQGDVIPLDYDPLLAKLTVFDVTRERALQKMKYAIDHFEIGGIKNTLAFGRWVMENKAFISGKYNTGFVKENLQGFLNTSNSDDEQMMAAVAAHIFWKNKSNKNKYIAKRPSANWRNRLDNI